MSGAKVALAVIGVALFGLGMVVLVRTIRAVRADDNIYERMWR